MHNQIEILTFLDTWEQGDKGVYQTREREKGLQRGEKDRKIAMNDGLWVWRET